MEIKSYAKLNLFLDVGDKRSDGYHSVCFINTQVSLHDVIRVKENEQGIIIRSTHPDVPTGPSNLCYKVVHELEQKYHINRGVDIWIEKSIPIAAGLGGGSSNAASVLMALNELWKLSMTSEDMINFIRPITTDGCYFITNGTCLIEGIGERVIPLKSIPRLELVVICPDAVFNGHKTKSIYDQLDEYEQNHGLQHSSIDSILGGIQSADRSQIIQGMNNIFLNITISQYQPVYELIAKLKKENVEYVGLCGAGPSVFTVCENLTVADEIATRYSKQYVKTFAAHTL